jgi:hypothetical protein
MRSNKNNRVVMYTRIGSPKNGTMYTTRKLDYIQFLQNELSPRLASVPGIGSFEIEKLQRAGIHTVYQLIGKYMSFLLSPQHGYLEFKAWLHTIDILDKFTSTLITCALHDKLSSMFVVLDSSIMHEDEDYLLLKQFF